MPLLLKWLQPVKGKSLAKNPYLIPIRPATMYRKTIFTCLLVWFFGGFLFGVNLDSLQNALPNMGQNAERVRALNTLAAKMIRIDYDASMRYANEALILARELGLKKDQGEALRARADLYSTSGLYQQATEDALAALALFEETNHRMGIAKAYTSLGVVSFYLRETDMALKDYEQARVM